MGSTTFTGMIATSVELLSFSPRRYAPDAMMTADNIAKMRILLLI